MSTTPASALDGQYMTMGFEGKFYVGPKGCKSPTDPGVILADSVRNPKYSYKYGDVDATLRRHMGTKAYMKGMLDVGVSFTLPNLKNDDGTRPADTALILESMRERRQPLTIIMLDEEGGEGIIGDFELFGGDKSEEDENLQEWEIEAKPSAAGRKVEWYDGKN
jgi:hypothetical protein